MDSDALDVLWQHLTENWEDEKAHAAFLEQAQHAGRLLEAATRYRDASADPTRADEATRRLKTITTLAMTQLSNARTTPAQAKRRAGAVAFVLVSLALTIASLLAYSLTR